MHFPELLAINALRQFSGALGQIVAWQWMMAEHIAHLIVEPVAEFCDDIIDGAATGAVVTAVFDKRDRCIHRPEDVIAILVDLWIEMINFCGHAPSLPFVVYLSG